MEKLKILAIDDSTVNLATIEQELKAKYEVIPIISGRRAIKYLYRETVDLILLDVEMPIMDGVETLEEIRAQKNGVTVPVIFLTANKDKSTVIDGARLGIMDYITKPFNPEDLNERIERVLKRSGVIPMGDEELYAHVQDIQRDLQTGHVKQALAKADEVMNYQIDEELSGRVRNVVIKLKQNNVESAQEMLGRVLDFMDQRMLSGKRENALPITESEIPERLQAAAEDLRNFKRKEAITKLEDLTHYKIGNYLLMLVQEVIRMLEEYDEVQAEERLNALLRKLQKNVSQ